MCAGADKCLVFTTDDISTVLTPSQTHFFIWRTLSILNNFLIHSPACSALKRLSLPDRYSRLLSPPHMPEVVPGSRTTVHTSAALCDATTSIHHYLWPPQVPAESQGTVALTQPEKGLFAGGQTANPTHLWEKSRVFSWHLCDAALGWSWLEDVGGAWLHLEQSHKCLQEDGRAEPLTRGRCWKVGDGT